MNGQFIRSAFDDTLVIDVMSGKATPGAPLQVWRIKEDPHSAALTMHGVKEPDNQLWNITAGPLEGAVFIEIGLADDLVIVVKGGKGEPATPLQLGEKAGGADSGSGGIESRVWRLTAVDAENDEALEGRRGTFIQSMLEPDLVIEISGGRNEPGTALQVGVKRPSGSAEEVRRARSQLWLLGAAQK